MFASEFRKQKVLFAASDALALFAAFAAALLLHDLGRDEGAGRSTAYP